MTTTDASETAALLQAILIDPSDQLARRIYADYLDDVIGDTDRAEFIRLQLDDPDCKLPRHRYLLQSRGANWIGLEGHRHVFVTNDDRRHEFASMRHKYSVRFAGGFVGLAGLSGSFQATEAILAQLVVIHPVSRIKLHLGRRLVASEWHDWVYDAFDRAPFVIADIPESTSDCANFQRFRQKALDRFCGTEHPSRLAAHNAISHFLLNHIRAEVAGLPEIPFSPDDSQSP